MADQSDELRRYIQNFVPAGQFTPMGFYDVSAKTLTCCFSNLPEYGKEINPYLTVHLTQVRDQVIGCVLADLADILRPIAVEQQGLRIPIAIVLARCEPDERWFNNPDARPYYEPLLRLATETEAVCDLSLSWASDNARHLGLNVPPELQPTESDVGFLDELLESEPLRQRMKGLIRPGDESDESDDGGPMPVDLEFPDRLDDSESLRRQFKETLDPDDESEKA